MKLLHRHLFASVALTSLAAVGVLTFIMMLVSLLRDLLGYVMAGQLPWETFAHLIWLTAPTVVCYALPMGVLTGVLLVLGQMSADHEITAIRSSGVSVAGISAPIFFFALLGTGATLAVNFYYFPRSKLAYETELDDAVHADPLRVIVPRTFIKEFKGKVIYVGSLNGRHLADVWVWDLDAQKRVKTLYRADTADISFNKEKSTIELVAYQVSLEARDEKDPENFRANQDHTVRADVFPKIIPLGQFFGVHEVHTKLKWLTLDQLLAERRRLEQPDAAVPPAEREKQRIRVQTVIQEKAATAFSVLGFALIAIPLGIKVSRRETLANFGLAMVLVMAYYLATVAVGMFDNQPELRPDLLMWVPNLAFQGLGVWMFRKVDRS